MRSSALKSIQLVLEQAIDAINDSFERGKQSQKIASEFDKEYDRLLALSNGHEPTIELEQSRTKQHQLVHLSSPMIEGFYPWRHCVVLAADSLAECGWTIEARAIRDELNRLRKHQVDWAQPGACDELRDEIRAVGNRIRDCLANCVTELHASKSNGGSVVQSSKPENPTETDDTFGTALARKQLRPYVDNPSFRKYVKEQILEWEMWHRSEVDEIRRHEIWRDQDKERLDHAISQGILDPEDKDDVYVLSYEWHKYEVTLIPENLEFRLVAEREPVCFQEASVAAMVAMFWCDINGSSMLVPDYSKQPDFDFLEPDGPFSKYLSEQRRNPIQGRYKHIDWFVEAAIKAYESTIASGGVGHSQEHDPPGKREPRLVVSDGDTPQATVDGTPISISKKQADLIRLLLDARGEYVSLAEHRFRSRDIASLPVLIGKFVETQPGAGTRIPRDILFADKDA